MKYWILRRRERNYAKLMVEGEYIKGWDPEKKIQEYIQLLDKESEDQRKGEPTRDE
ncbi:MAG: hypothetical protein K6T73_11325 [Candidatus Bathyarchaeota archaeon]|nr:hypothetical protein [Candidatus Bathyarchaeota archaeon]